MMRTLLVRGMLVGVVAGLLAFGFAKIFGEPPVDSAIAFETATHQAAGDAPEMALVSRGVQAGLGLFTAVVVYGAAFGGLFAIAFAFAYGRARLSPRMLAALLAGLGFLAVVLVPQIKYPANPPSVGAADTIGFRTAMFALMLAASLAATLIAATLRARFARRYGEWNAFLIGAGAFLVVIVAAILVLPSINEVPEHFPAVLLWRFRLAALGTQAVMWTTIGLLFGAITEKHPIGRA